MNINCQNTEFADLISLHLHKQVPCTTCTGNDLVEILTEILYGGKNVRYGSLPPVEAQVVVRDVIRHWTSLNEPIPCLIPWGSIKADFSPNVDIAEVSAISILMALNTNVKQYYAPGLKMVMRIEDTSGFQLFAMEKNYNSIVVNSIDYSNSLVNLLYILSHGEIIPFLESEMTNALDFEDKEKVNTELILNYLKESTGVPEDMNLESFQILKQMGWKGYISTEQREFYLGQYRKHYHDYNEDKLLRRLAMYFGGSFTRHQLEMTGKGKTWGNKFLQIAFNPPIKGLPEGYNYNYLYYRTIPANQARTHMPGWRCKGYLKIEGRTVNSKICSFHDVPEDLIQNSVVLSDGDTSVTVKTDFVLA
jgi:hypothetical protein